MWSYSKFTHITGIHSFYSLPNSDIQALLMGIEYLNGSTSFAHNCPLLTQTAPRFCPPLGFRQDCKSFAGVTVNNLYVLWLLLNMPAHSAQSYPLCNIYVQNCPLIGHDIITQTLHQYCGYSACILNTFQNVIKTSKCHPCS